MDKRIDTAATRVYDAANQATDNGELADDVVRGFFTSLFRGEDGAWSIVFQDEEG